MNSQEMNQIQQSNLSQAYKAINTLNTFSNDGINSQESFDNRANYSSQDVSLFGSTQESIPSFVSSQASVFEITLSQNSLQPYQESTQISYFTDQSAQTIYSSQYASDSYSQSTGYSQSQSNNSPPNINSNAQNGRKRRHDNSNSAPLQDPVKGPSK